MCCTGGKHKEIPHNPHAWRNKVCWYSSMRFTSQLRLSLPHRYFIRLNKDVKAMGDLSYVQCTFTEDPSALLLNYKDSIYNGTRIPTRFMIKVSKYYPHQSPVVTCLEVEFSATFVSPEGEILHSHLQNQWSALGTIKTVVDIIQSVRPQLCTNWYEECDE